MSIRVVCPSCDQVYNLDDSLRGKTVRCRACQNGIDVPRASRPDRAGEDRRSRDGRVSASRPAPPPPRSSPAGRGRERDRDDERDPGRRSGGEGGGNNHLVLILAGGGVAAVLLLSLVVGILVLVFSGKGGAGNDPVAASSTTAASSPSTPANNVAPADQPKKPAPAEMVAPPPGPAPAEIATDVVQQVKKSTAYLRVNMPSGGVASGSGFFAAAPGIVVTNAHVLGMLRADSLPPRSVDVVIYSGEPGETKMTGRVLGVDRDNDLAVLRVDGDASRLPRPLAVDSASKLTETQKVYIFGFPFGERLGKAISVNPSTISSLRKGENGQLKQLQVNGGMNPGNSGGPVTDPRGVVIGVSVAGIPGTQINFAIPGDFVLSVLNGKVEKTDMSFAYRSGGEARLPIRTSCLDPLGRIQQVKVDVWSGPAGAAPPASTEAPQPRPGDGSRQSFTLAARDGGYAGEVVLPTPRDGHVLWVQPMMVNGAGVTQWDTARVVPAEFQNPLDRVAAMLQFKAPTSKTERTLKLNRQTTVNIFRGNSKLTVEDRLQGNVVETLQPEPGKGTKVRLILGHSPYSSRIGDKEMEPPAEAHTILRKHSPTFYLNAAGACGTATKHTFRNLRLHKEAVNEMYQALCHVFEVTSLPLTNRQVQPQESWQPRMPMYTMRNGRISVNDIFLTCTFEGVSTVRGRREAFISLKGRVKGRGRLAKVELGKVSGHAQVDLDGGFVSRVKLITTTEVESEGTDSRLLVHDESSVERTEGNSLGLTPPPDEPVVQNQPRPGTQPRPGNQPRPAAGGTLAADLQALKGTWVSGDINAEGGQGTGTVELTFTPVAGRMGGLGKLKITTKRAGRSTSSTQSFSFTLQQKGAARLIVSSGVRGTGLAFVYKFDDDQLLLTGRVVSRRIGYSLQNVSLRRGEPGEAPAIAAGQPGKDNPAFRPGKDAARGAADAIKWTGDVYSFVQAAVKDDRFTDVDVRGFTLGKDRYRDVAENGGVLIGFQFGMGTFVRNEVIKSWRPIFRTRDGEKFGKWHGAVPASPKTVKAREGYVVSGLSVRTGLGLDGLSMRFARLGKDRLDLTDTYESEWVGGQGGSPATVGGKGALFIGVTGHLSHDKSPCSIGLVAVLPRP